MDLRECPFCGSDARYRSVGARGDWLRIECANPYGACCEMQTASCTDEARKILTEKWNTRYADATITNLLIEQSKDIWDVKLVDKAERGE